MNNKSASSAPFMRRVDVSKPVVVKRRDLPRRASPCASKCRHAWCDGYNAGYSDGEEDARKEKGRP